MGNKSHQRIHKYGSNGARFLFYIITMAAIWRMNSREKKLETMNPIEDLVRVSQNDYKTVVGEMKEKRENGQIQSFCLITELKTIVT